jgi:hypothetical protein
MCACLEASSRMVEGKSRYLCRGAWVRREGIPCWGVAHMMWNVSRRGMLGRKEIIRSYSLSFIMCCSCSLQTSTEPFDMVLWMSLLHDPLEPAPVVEALCGHMVACKLVMIPVYLVFDKHMWSKIPGVRPLGDFLSKKARALRLVLRGCCSFLLMCGTAARGCS